ncbi:MAG: DUF6174 domain-containing protein [Spirochaetaceae bacterium]|nr:DUF6174 domain-containing protein [Spirochaetaceae bacterium]
MIRKSFIILIILLYFPAALFAFGSKEKNNSAEIKELSKYEKQWKKSKIKNYTQEIVYSRAAFPPEQLTMTVKNNIVQNWTTSFEKKTSSNDSIESFTIENMFKKARESLNAKDNFPFEFKISYNQELGYITSFSCIPSSKGDIIAPFNRSYRIDVISLKTIKADL